MSTLNHDFERVREDGSEPVVNQFSVCDSCDKNHTDLYFCNVCKCAFCAKCWDLETPHRKKRLAPGAIPHQKTELELARRVHVVFSNSVDDAAFEQLHAEDQNTTWFGKY